MNSANGSKKLVRPHAGRVIAGVCAGFGGYTGVDANIFRIALAAITLFTVGIGGVVLYLVGWAVIPDEDGKSLVDSYLNTNRDS